MVSTIPSRISISMSLDSTLMAREVLAARSGGPPVVLATIVSAPEEPALIPEPVEGSKGSVSGPEPIEGSKMLVPVGAKMLLRSDGSLLGSFDDGLVQEAVTALAQETLRRHAIETYYIALDGRRLTRHEAEQEPSYQVMIEPHEAPDTLVIVGGGHIGKALAEMGKMCAFHVAVVDDRPDYANRERFPDADEVICGDFVDSLRNYPIDSNTYVVCVTRGHKHDEVSLRQVVDSPARYVGMIGSQRRVSAVLQHIVEDGVSQEAVARVHTPIGLDIGAETPEEIAVSIMGEIIQVRRGGSGLPMRQVKRVKAVRPPRQTSKA